MVTGTLGLGHALAAGPVQHVARPADAAGPTDGRALAEPQVHVAAGARLSGLARAHLEVPARAAEAAQLRHRWVVPNVVFAGSEAAPAATCGEFFFLYGIWMMV